ncbi:NUDIX hydrolase [Actinotalea fermentans]|uniref:Coenzyme A pyrophosphatase n=1 Tax=Actinotalea fermentans TaxID=43671 RepID=A0A511YU81_9CELL|nr:CoA pyrophosphatase [Actinotalea fermentans]GEN78750.1 coenzyme A pyrophosphatase [Actinotalea fermentans]
MADSRPGEATATEGARAQLAALAARGVAWPPLPPVSGHPRPAAVLVLFGVLDGRPAVHPSAAVPADLDLLLVGRAASLAHHPGQVAFPGGRLEEDDDGPEAAALREAEEETGLDPAGVEVLGTLAQLPVHVSNHVVVPVLAWWATPSPVAVVDHRESATVFRAPVADLVDPANRRTAVLPARFAGGRPRPARPDAGPAFLVPHAAGTHLVWGFTALVLDRLLTELGWSEPWDTSRTFQVPL